MASNIVLIGMPGAGKSTVGVILAKQLSYGFIDTDILVQTREKRPLQEIVDSGGYMELRRIEEEALLDLRCRDHVIATGGSAVYSDKAMKRLKKSGTVVFLQASLNVLCGRISNFETRGIAKRNDQDFSSLFEERRPLYENFADFRISCDALTQEEVSNAIVAAVNPGILRRPCRRP